MLPRAVLSTGALLLLAGCAAPGSPPVLAGLPVGVAAELLELPAGDQYVAATIDFAEPSSADGFYCASLNVTRGEVRYAHVAWWELGAEGTRWVASSASVGQLAHARSCVAVGDGRAGYHALILASFDVAQDASVTLAPDGRATIELVESGPAGVSYYFASAAPLGGSVRSHGVQASRQPEPGLSGAELGWGRVSTEHAFAGVAIEEAYVTTNAPNDVGASRFSAVWSSGDRRFGSDSVSASAGLGVGGSGFLFVGNATAPTTTGFSIEGARTEAITELHHVTIVPGPALARFSAPERFMTFGTDPLAIRGGVCWHDETVAARCDGLNARPTT